MIDLNGLKSNLTSALSFSQICRVMYEVLLTNTPRPIVVFDGFSPGDVIGVFSTRRTQRPFEEIPNIGQTKGLCNNYRHKNSKKTLKYNIQQTGVPI